MGRGMGWWVVGRGCKTWCACNIEKSKSNTSINTNISSCLYQCYCVSSHFTIRDYFIFPQKLKSVLNFLHFTCNFRGLRFRVFGLRFRYNRVSRPLGTNKRQKNSHLLTLNLSAEQASILTRGTYVMCAWIVWIWSLSPSKPTASRSRAYCDCNPIRAFETFDISKEPISKTSRFWMFWYNRGCNWLGAIKGMTLRSRGFSRGSLFKT